MSSASDLDTAIAIQQQRELMRQKWSEAEAATITRLSAYRTNVAKYLSRKDEYEQVLPLITPVYSDMPKGESVDCKADRVADERWRLREELDKMRDALIEERAWIIGSAGRVGGMGEVVIIRRYLNGQTIEKIAALIPCNESTVKRWHRRGIRVITERCTEMHWNARCQESHNTD